MYFQITKNTNPKKLCCWCEEEIVAEFAIYNPGLEWTDHACRKHVNQYFAPRYLCRGECKRTVKVGAKLPMCRCGMLHVAHVGELCDLCEMDKEDYDKEGNYIGA
jgi:hypothetical protein